MHDQQHYIKPIEPILPIKAEIEYNKQKQDFTFHKYFIDEVKKHKKPLTKYGHIEVDI